MGSTTTEIEFRRITLENKDNMFQLFKSVTRDQKQAHHSVPAVKINKLSAVALILGATLTASACGTSAVGVSVKNPGIVMNATTLPTETATFVHTNVPVTLAPATSVAAASTNITPGISTPGTAGVVPSASPTDLVVDYLLFGTPTKTPGTVSSSGGNAVTVTPAFRATDVSNSTPTEVPATAPTVIAPTAVSAPVTAAATSAAAAPAAAGGVSPTPDASSDLVGDASRGQALFQGAGGCSACHNVANANVLVGPSLKGVAVRAQTRKPGYSAAQYIHESIVAPNAYVVTGFTPGIMPQTFLQTLTPQQIADLVAYLLTLGQ